ncbi:MAG: hypothetical protein C5B50_05855 [Verrucomicrobia bacterium]|nr:MAG: hypothetical protein C5B50_05855 [Verrucomicrobiota bacterium]
MAVAATVLVSLTLIVTCKALQTSTPTVSNQPLAITDSKSGIKANLWLGSSLKRVFPKTMPGSTNLALLAPRNGRVSFQACARNCSTRPLKIQCSIEGGDDLKPQVRMVGLVPMPHLTPNTDPSELDGADSLPGLVPDPLFPQSNMVIGPQESRSFWVTLRTPPETRPGLRELAVHFSLADGKQSAQLPVHLEISPLVVQPRHDFSVIHWWRGEATWDYYKTGMFDKRWYELTRAQLADMLDHGSDVVYVPMFFDRRETFKRPCQLLGVNEPTLGKYQFDWSEVKLFTDMCKDIGFKKFEWSHLWIYWGVENPVRVYRKAGDQFTMLWPPDISGFSDTFTNFLGQFLPEFHDFLQRERLLDASFFHLSDEPGGGQHIANYKRARQILHDLAPWMKVMDALSDIQYGKQSLTDMPIPIVSSAQAYIDAKIPHWVYFCCSPHGPWLNRFMDTPLPKIRMSGWLFYHLGAKGFLHWGFNYWHKMEREEIGDPFHDASNADWPGIPYGDPFMIYPGENGPIDSLRWEVFAESLQDYAILQTARIKPEDELLSSLKSYANFPKSAAWIDGTLKKMLKP